MDTSPRILALAFLLLFASASAGSDAAANAASDAAASGTGAEKYGAALPKKMRRFVGWLEERFGIVLESKRCPIQIALQLVTTGVDAADADARPEFATYATRNIRKGEPILVAPREMVIGSPDVGSPYEPPRPSHIRLPGDSWLSSLGKDTEWAETTALAAWVLREKAKGNSSEWAPYIDILPEKVPLAVFWPAYALRLFEYLPFQQLVEKLQRMLRHEYKRCHNDAIAGATKQQFDWAMSIAVSRAFSSGREDPSSRPGHRAFNERYVALIPVADMANHDNWGRTVWHQGWPYEAEPVKPKSATSDVPRGAEVYFAIRDVKKGEEILGNYGVDNNDKLLAHYGFLLSPNYNDDYMFFKDIRLVTREFEMYALTSPFSSHEADMALDIAARASTTVIEAARRAYARAPADQKKFFVSRGDRAFGPHGGIGLWPDGHVDPRLLAALASLAIQFIGRVKSNLAMWRNDGSSDLGFDTVDLDSLAEACLKYGWRWGIDKDEDCGDLVSDLGPAHEHAVRVAGKIVHSMTERAMLSFTTTLGEDAAELVALEEEAGCGAGADPAQECPTQQVLSEEKKIRLTALRFRMGKKEILTQAFRRLKDSCNLF